MFLFYVVSTSFYEVSYTVFKVVPFSKQLFGSKPVLWYNSETNWLAEELESSGFEC
jgi:hypothetical protein